MAQPSESTANEIEFLRYYLDQTWEEMRHVENLRANFVGTIVSITVLVLGFAGQQDFERSTVPVSLCVVFLGLFGAVAVNRFTRMHDEDQLRLHVWHKYWGELIGSSVLTIRNKSDAEHRARRRRIDSVRHRHIWYSMCLSCSLGGAICTLIALSRHT